MGWLDDLFEAIGKAVVGYPVTAPTPIILEEVGGALKGPADPSDEHKSKPVILGATAAVLGGVALAPFVYRAYSRPRRGKRAKQAQELALAVDDASNRAVTLLAALLPAVGLPIAYLGVQELEARGVISKGLGDSVQTLIAAGAVAPAIGGVASLAASVK